MGKAITDYTDYADKVSADLLEEVGVLSGDQVRMSEEDFERIRENMDKERELINGGLK